MNEKNIESKSPVKAMHTVIISMHTVIELSIFPHEIIETSWE